MRRISHDRLGTPYASIAWVLLITVAAGGWACDERRGAYIELVEEPLPERWEDVGLSEARFRVSLPPDTRAEFRVETRDGGERVDALSRVLRTAHEQAVEGEFRLSRWRAAALGRDDARVKYTLAHELHATDDSGQARSPFWGELGDTDNGGVEAQWPQARRRVSLEFGKTYTVWWEARGEKVNLAEDGWEGQETAVVITFQIARREPGEAGYTEVVEWPSTE